MIIIKITEISSMPYLLFVKYTAPKQLIIKTKIFKNSILFADIYLYGL